LYNEIIESLRLRSAYGRARERRAGALEGVGDAEEEGLVGDGADELEADGQAVGCETAVDGNGREAGEVGRAVVAEEQSASGMIRAADGSGLLTDGGRRNGSSGDDEGVELGIGHGGVEATNERFALLQGVQIRCGGNLCAQFEAGSGILAIIRGARGEPSRASVVMRSFCPGAFGAGGLGFV